MKLFHHLFNTRIKQVLPFIRKNGKCKKLWDKYIEIVNIKFPQELNSEIFHFLFFFLNLEYYY